MYNGECHTSNKSEGKLQVMPTPDTPLDTVHIDHFGPISKFVKAYINDYRFFTRFVWLFAVKSTTSQETIKHLNSLFDIFGNPKQVLHLLQSNLQTFSVFITFRLIVVASWVNGIVERVNRFLKSLLKKINELSE